MNFIPVILSAVKNDISESLLSVPLPKIVGFPHYFPHYFPIIDNIINLFYFIRVIAGMLTQQAAEAAVTLTKAENTTAAVALNSQSVGCVIILQS